MDDELRKGYDLITPPTRPGRDEQRGYPPASAPATPQQPTPPQQPQQTPAPEEK